MMEFNDKEICKCLKDEDITSYIIIDTTRSPYNGKRYKLLANLSYFMNHVRIRRNKKVCYYEWSSVKLTPNTYKKFEDIKSRNYNICDVLGKNIQENTLLHNDGGIYKVGLITKKYIYVTNVRKEDDDNYSPDLLYELYDYNMVHDQALFRIDADDSDRFLLIDNPLDMLRI